MVNAPCIKVDKAYGERTIAITKKTGLFNSNLRIHHENGYLCIPLNEKPQKTDLEELKTNLASFEVLRREFLERVEHQPAFIELLSDKVPPHLFASLPRSLDIVGDIAVVEIPPELQEHKGIVGQAILAANKPIVTVLAKAGAVGGDYRLRDFETIAGINKTKTIHREHECVFHVDLAKAYFSTRLSYEHNRVASLVEDGETVLDMFAGVGPFSVLIAKKHKDVHVYATEVNPEAFRLLKINIRVNRVAASVEPVLGDVREVARERLPAVVDRVVMNLPEKAIEYVDVACNAIKPEGGIMHYYEFSSSSNPLESAENRLTEAVRQTSRKVEEIMGSRIVRGVAPFRWQLAVDAVIK